MTTRQTPSSGLTAENMGVYWTSACRRWGEPQALAEAAARRHRLPSGVARLHPATGDCLSDQPRRQACRVGSSRCPQRRREQIRAGQRIHQDLGGTRARRRPCTSPQARRRAQPHAMTLERFDNMPGYSAHFAPNQAGTRGSRPRSAPVRRLGLGSAAICDGRRLRRPTNETTPPAGAGTPPPRTPRALRAGTIRARRYQPPGDR